MMDLYHYTCSHSRDESDLAAVSRLVASRWTA